MHVVLLSVLLALFTIVTYAHPEIDAIALKVGKQIEKKAREECHSLANDQVADDLPSATDEERAQKIYSNSYERCMMEAMEIIKKDISTMDIQPKHPKSE